MASRKPKGKTRQPAAGPARRDGERRKRGQAPAPAEPPPSSPPPLGPIVGIGASAGGLEALHQVFESLPERTGMAFVVVQHLDPSHDSLLAELLQKYAHLPAHQARDRVPLEPDQIYVIPIKSELTVEGGRLRVRPAPQRHGFPIDRLFESLAEDQGPNAVCVLLSGAGTDGTLGLRAVKEHGGMTVAQSPETAHYDSIVRSAIATGMVDHVLAPSEIPARLVEYAEYLRRLPGRVPAETEANGPTVARICELVRRKTGHDFSGYKKTTILRRIQRRMQVTQTAEMERYLEALRRDGKELEQLFRDLLIGVTQFFRDPAAFEALEQRVIPEIVRHERAAETIRVWTPGCATGEEAYSVAILLREALDHVQANPKVQIFAGDIDDESLEVARLGRFSEAISQQMSPARLHRFFDKQGHGYQVTKGIRDMVIFSRHSLIRDPPFSRLDLIVCRNVLIYLESPLQKQAAVAFHYALRPGGFLFLGPSESVAGPADLFRVVDKKYHIYQRTETLGRPAFHVPRGSFEAQIPEVASAGAAAPKRGEPKSPGLLQKLERLVLDQHAPPWVVVNRQGETLYFSSRTGPYLEPASGAPTVDLLSLARRGLRGPLRGVFQQAMKTGRPADHRGLALSVDGDAHTIDLLVRPVSESDATPHLFLVLFQDRGVESRRRAAAREADPVDDGLAQQLEAELRATREHLQATIEESEASNEELKSANEELQSANEELQATNEELQTSKEELQSVNEELETINAELAKKAEELDWAHSDLQNLFQSTRIATLFLDRELRVKRFTQAATEVFRLIPTDLGRPITDIVAQLPSTDLLDDVREVLRTLGSRERKVRSNDGSTVFLVRVLPYRRLDDLIDGVVLTFTDVSQLEEARQRAARLAAVVESSQDAIFCADLEDRITIWNQGATEMLGWSQADAVGQPSSFVVPEDRREEAEEVVARLRRGETVPSMETVRVSRSGRRIPVLATVSPVRDGDGRLVGSSTALRDVTEMTDKRDGYREAGRRKDEFFALLSHELRNPLAPLRTALEIARDGAVDAGQRDRALQIMARQVARMTSIVDQLLGASRIATGTIELRRERMDLRELVRLTVEDYRPTLEPAGLSVELDLGGAPIWIDGDPNRLAQVMANLLSNASKYTERGDRVTVSAAAEPPARATEAGEAKARPTRRRILLIEDNPDAAEATRILLALDGHEVVTAVDGLEGLEKARSFRPEYVLCDLGLPGRLDGLAVAQALRQDPRLRGTRLVALTGMGRDEDRQRAFAAGFDRHLTKPTDPRELRRMFAE
jgi:two-component system CheB/CheR fusion protein